MKYKPNKFFLALNNNADEFLKQKKLLRTVSIKEALSDLEAAHEVGVCPDSRIFKSGKYGSPQNNYQRYCRTGSPNDIIPDSHRFANNRK